jgi:hypothetical protein
LVDIGKDFGDAEKLVCSPIAGERRSARSQF